MSSLKELEKKTQKQGREGLIENLVTRRFSSPLTALLIKTPVTANQVTGISLLFGLFAAVLFSSGTYVYQVVGVILLFVSHVLDFSDGEIARLKGTSSMFGSWWDECVDRIREYGYLLGLTIGFFRQSHNVSVLIIGMIAGMNMMMIHFLRQLSELKLTDKKRASEFKIGKKYYLGLTGTTIYIVMLAVIFKLVYWLLLVYAVLGTAAWLRKLYSGFKHRKTDIGKKQHVWE